MPNTKKPKVPWAEGDAKRILKRELKKGAIPLNADDMAPRVVYMQHPEFADYPYEQFRDRLNDLRNKIKEKKARSTFDTHALERDRESHPKPAKNHRGEPRWEGSQAERLLKRDIDNRQHETLTPKALHNTQKEYKDYPLLVFRKHIYQEVKRRKFIAQRKAMAEKKKEEE